MPEAFIIALEFLLLLIANIVTGAIGFIPSVFMTALNIKWFGLEGGAVLTLLGEIIGALAGFYLYRLGFHKAKDAWKSHRFWSLMQQQSTSRIFFAVIALRLLPFVPSGIVTAGAAITAIRPMPFLAASTIGKIPAVFFELAIVYGVIQTVPAGWHWIPFAGIFFIAVWSWQKKRSRSIL